MNNESVETVTKVREIKRELSLILMLLLVSASAICVAYSVHLSRSYIGEMSRLNKQQDDLQVQWEKLLVEINMLTAYNRVEQQAMKHLHMNTPDEGQVRILDLRGGR